MLTFPNVPPTLLPKEPFPESTTLSKLKLGWIALWMLNSEDSQGVQVWKSSLEEEASSVVLVPGEPLLLFFYYVLCGLQRPLHLPCSEQWGGGTMCFRQLLRARKTRASSDWKNSGSSSTNSSHKDWLYTLDANHLGISFFTIYPSQDCHLVSHGVCRRWGSGGEGAVHMWLEVPTWVLGYPRIFHQAIPDAGLFGGNVIRNIIQKWFSSGTFSSRRVSWVLVHIAATPPPPMQLSVDLIQAVCVFCR